MDKNNQEINNSQNSIVINNSGNMDLKINTFPREVLVLTRKHFEQELNKFLSPEENAPPPIYPLYRLSYDTEGNQPVVDKKGKEVFYISDISDKNVYVHLPHPYQGVLLEIIILDRGLEVIPYHEHSRESITTYENGMFRHKGFTWTKARDEDYQKLLDWLATLKSS